MMKKNSKRVIRDYTKYSFEDIEYHGLLPKKRKIRIDSKRLIKMVYIEDEIKRELMKPRKTVYFIPRKNNRYEYMINYFRDEIKSIKNFWQYEIIPAINNIKTPAEAEENTKMHYLLTGISEDYDDASFQGFFAGIRRQIPYFEAIRLMIAQYYHVAASRIEAITVKVLRIKGRTEKKFNRDMFYQYINDMSGITYEEMKSKEHHDKFYKIWHFLKHNNQDTYDKLARDYPDTLIQDSYKNKEYQDGELAMKYVDMNIDKIMSYLDGVEKFFEEFCEICYKENVKEADWNYDEFFINLVKDHIRLIDNPLDIV